MSLIGTSGTLVAGNFIGTDGTGTAALGKYAGVEIIGASANTVGGSTAGAGQRHFRQRLQRRHDRERGEFLRPTAAAANNLVEGN